MPSLFGEILSELVGTVPGALGAVFLDWEGEAVDQFSHIPLMDILLVGAHWGVVLRIVQDFLRKHDWGLPQTVILNGEQHDVIIRAITDEYCLVFITRSGAHLATALDAMDRVVVDIRKEM